ncbi:hypothetical protein GCM10007298_24490 [Williamsia phyllosphaerae]|uniref:Uncharacterized protein n=1 Tax=Williamsia phyllosphaerae TaxID=885042 RepID=A0ABQ1UUX9_9NOCA|nr:hypothetical protein GCM10007298_24490 [Williamsia phyllosphaerae]
MTGTLLVTDEDVSDLLGVEQRVVHGQDAPARETEDDLHTEFLERSDDGLGATHALRGHRCRTDGAGAGR